MKQNLATLEWPFSERTTREDFHQRAAHRDRMSLDTAWHSAAPRSGDCTSAAF